MITVQENVRHGHAVQVPRTGILGIFQQAVRKGFLLWALGAPENAGDEAGQAIYQNDRSRFSAGEDIVADADLFVNAGIQRPLVNSLLMAAEQNQFLLFRQLSGKRRRQLLPAGTEIDPAGMRVLR